MNRDEIGAADNAVYGCELNAELVGAFLGQERVECHDIHAECLRTLCDFAADPAHPHNAQGFVAQLHSEEGFAVPYAVDRLGIGLRNMAGQSDHHGKRMLSGRDRVSVWSIDNNNTALRGGFEVDIIHSDSGAANHFQLRSGTHNTLGYAGLAPDQKAVVLSDYGSELIFAEPCLLSTCTSAASINCWIPKSLIGSDTKTLNMVSLPP